MPIPRTLPIALAVGLALLPSGVAPAQEDDPGERAQGPFTLRFFQDGRPDPEQMEQFRRQFEQMQRRLPGNARVFGFNPEGMLVEPGQADSLFTVRIQENQIVGLTLKEVPQVLRAHLDLPEDQGVVVSEVAEDSPAAGVIEPNDILLRLGDTPLSKPSDLARLLGSIEGDPLSMTLVRAGEEQTVELELPGLQAEESECYRLGVSINEPDDAVRSQLDLPEGQGVIVMEVMPESPAEKAGLKSNDILIEIDGKPITGAEELAELVQESGGDPVELTLIRDGEETTIEVTAEKVAAPTDAPRPPVGMRFFGPGVMIDPETGAIRPGGTRPGPGGPGPGPGGPGQRRMFPLPGPVNPELERRLDEILDQLKELREEVDTLKQSRPRRRNQDG